MLLILLLIDSILYLLYTVFILYYLVFRHMVLICPLHSHDLFHVQLSYDSY